MSDIPNSSMFLYDIGGIDNPLNLIINQVVTSVRIHIPGNSTYLNFESLKIIDEHGSMVGDGAKVVSSPLHQSAADTNRNFLLFTNLSSSYHSSHSDAPYYEIEFDAPVFAHQLILSNRSGKWGIRLLKICVECRLNQFCVYSYSNYSEFRSLQSLSLFKLKIEESAYFSRLLNVKSEISLIFSDFLNSRFDDVNSACVFDLFKEKLIQCVKLQPPDDHERSSVALILFRLVNRFSSTGSPSELDLKCLSMAIACAIGTELLDFQSKQLGLELVRWNLFYKNPEELLVLQSEVNDSFASIGKFGDVIISRHGWRVAPLSSHKHDYLKLIESVLDILQGLNYSAFLAYGTLLGARRASRFIAHDDDVDIGIVIYLNTAEMLPAILFAISSNLNDAGYKSEIDSDYQIIQVGSPSVPTGLDIFPCCVFLDSERNILNSTMHHKNMVPISLDIEKILPISEIDLEGKTFSAPHDVSYFLEWRYGDGWDVSDQFFEFSWIFKY